VAPFAGPGEGKSPAYTCSWCFAFLPVDTANFPFYRKADFTTISNNLKDGGVENPQVAIGNSVGAAMGTEVCCSNRPTAQ